MLSLDEGRRQLQALGRYLLEHQLAWGNAGNISLRTAPERCLITASGTFLGELADADLVECALDDSPPAAGQRRPSKELPMHRAIYQTRPDVNAVLHAAPFYSTLVACSDIQIPASWFVEAMYYLERVARVPYHHPGSTALGEAVRVQAGQANILLLENHGVLVYDSSLREARTALEVLELVCRMLITARAAGVPMQALPPATVQDFLENSGYRPRREWPGS